MEVAPGAEAVLRVPENVNDGWQATLDGKRLEAETVDGWQQGWVVPAGEGGLVRLDFAPDRSYRAALLVGGGLALLLLLGTGIAWLRDRRRRASLEPVRLARVATEPVRVTRWGVLGCAGGAFVLGGVGLAAGCVIGAYLPATARRWAGAGLVALATCAAGVAAALDRRGAIEALDLAAAVAVGLLLMSLVERVRKE